MSRIVLAQFALIVAIPLAGCTGGVSENQNALVLGTTGAVAGGAIGAAVAPGNPVLGGVLGALIGGTAGTLVGRQLDKESERRRQEAIERAAATPTQTTSWTGKDPGTSGQVRFQTKPAATTTGQTCAIVQETITIGGQPQQADRQTCRKPDGSWS